MWLAICSAQDLAGLWAALGLRKRGLEPLEILLPEEFFAAEGFLQRISDQEDEVRMRLRDGRGILGGELRGVLNRLDAVPASRVAVARPADRDYLHQELHAVALSWLFALQCPVMNPPTPTYLGGPFHSRGEWLRLAHLAGFDTPELHMASLPSSEVDSGGSDGEVIARAFVVGEHVVVPAGAPRIDEGCRDLARLAGASLLGIEFSVLPEQRWRFARASPVPDLRLGGDALLDALAVALKG